MAADRGMKAIRLDVLEGNLPAEKLYQKVGFQYAGSLNIFYEDTGWADFNLYEYSISYHPDQGAGKGLAGQIE